LRRQLAQIPFRIAWVIKRSLWNLGFEALNRVINESRKKERAGGPHVSTQNGQESVRIGWIEMSENGKKPDDIESRLDR